MPSTTRSQRTRGLPPHSEEATPATEAAENGRPEVIYVSYDGIAEPLGRSQVLSYLVCLADDFRIRLISFEKSRRPDAATRRKITAAGIEWIPLRYHRRPAVLSTIVDVLAGRRALIHAAHRAPPAIVHVRSDVAALIASTARPQVHAKLLFDIRGLWADERVEGGLWPAGGLLYRTAKRYERHFYAEADAIVTLTRASVPQIAAWTGRRNVPIEVVPTCVDLTRFTVRAPRADGPHAVWTGSLGTWYRFDLVPRLAQALSLPLTVVTRQAEDALRVLDGYPAAVSAAAPDEMPERLFARDVGLCLVRPSFSKSASAPTRFAEYLAAGMPVVVTPAVGDLEKIVEERMVGTVLRGEDDQSIKSAVAEIFALMRDDGLVARCRKAAEDLFDLEVGSARYARLYRQLNDAQP